MVGKLLCLVGGLLTLDANYDSSEEAARCKAKCLDDFEECGEQCHVTGCDNDCRRGMARCLDSCPYGSQCPNGCDECENWACQTTCRDPANERDWETCRDMADAAFLECNYGCGTDVDCILHCIEQNEQNLSNCPCGANCLDGCPCSNFDCSLLHPTTTPQPTTSTIFPDTNLTNVLVLNQYSYQVNKPMMFNTNGSLVEVLKFEYPYGTGSYASCSVTFRNKMTIFGGHHYLPFVRQISEVDNCGLKLVGTLPGDFAFGACNVFNIQSDAEHVLLCFGLDNYKACWRYDGNTLAKEKSSTFDHWVTSLGNFQDHAAALGSYFLGENRDFEIMHSDMEQYWEDLGHFPFAAKFIYDYSFVTMDDALLVFGGATEQGKSKIAAQYAGSWTSLGELLTPRRGHRTIRDGAVLLHIGGAQTNKFEIWHVSATSVTRDQYKAELTDFDEYPESFWVSDDFCQ